jgi:hypothetical protein
MSLPTTTQQKIANLLSHGVQQSVVAAACGISPGRLSQILEEGGAELTAMLAAEAAKKVDSTVEREQSLDVIERKLLSALPGLVDECTSLGEGTRALSILAEMRARMHGLAGRGVGSAGNGIGAGVQLNLSSVANMQISVVLGENRAILSIGGQEVQPMPRDTVERFLDHEYSSSELPDF